MGGGLGEGRCARLTTRSKALIALLEDGEVVMRIKWKTALFTL